MDKTKALNKWAPVIESIGYKGKKIKEMSCYCETHSLMEDKLAQESYILNQAISSIGKTTSSKTTNGIYTPYTDSPSLLPLSIRVLANIYNLNNYDNILFVTGNELEKVAHYASYDVSKDLASVLDKGDLIEFIEKEIVKIISKEIGNTLNELCLIKRDMSGMEGINNGNIIIFNANCLIQSIQIISEGTMTPRMCVKYEYGVKSTGNTTLISELEVVRTKIHELQELEKELSSKISEIR
jgi:hypothetical protein